MSSLDEIMIEEPDVESSTLDYQQRFSGDIGAWFIQRQSSGLVKLLQSLNHKANAIDFGGGHGQNILPLKELGFDVVILGSDESCKQLILNEIESGKASFHRASMLDSKVPNRSFQTVTSFRMLPHLDQWQEHIGELCRVADQTVIIEFPTVHSINIISSGLFGLKKKVEKNTRKFNLFSLKKVEQEFSKYGFVLTGKVGQYVLPMALYRLVKVTALAKVIEGFFSVIGISSYIGSPMICCFTRKEHD